MSPKRELELTPSDLIDRAEDLIGPLSHEKKVALYARVWNRCTSDQSDACQNILQAIMTAIEYDDSVPNGDLMAARHAM